MSYQYPLRQNPSAPPPPRPTSTGRTRFHVRYLIRVINVALYTIRAAAINTGVNEFMADEVLPMSELHLTVTTGEALAGPAGHLADVTDVSLELRHGVEVTLTHVAAIQPRQVVAGWWRTGRRVRWWWCWWIDLFDVHL